MAKADGHNEQCTMDNVQWKTVKLGDLGYSFSGLSGKAIDDFGEGKPFIPYMNIFSNGRIDPNKLEYVRIADNEHQNKVEQGDWFFTTSSETPEEVGMTSVLVDDIGEAYLNSFCFGFRLYNKQEFDPEFVSYLFRSEELRKKISLFAQGSTRYNLPKQQMFDKLYFSYPDSLPAQRRIAAILSSADKVIEQTRQLIGKYKSIKQGMMKDLLKPKEGWKKYKYKDVIIENRLGGNYENSTANTGYPVIKMGNIMRGYISLEKVQYLPFEKSYNPDDVLKKGDLLFNTRNTLDLVGKVSIWNNEIPFALYNSNLLRMKFEESIIGSNVFMNYYFNYHKTLMELRGFAIGTTSVAAIYSRDLDRLNIIVPSVSEQRRIAKILSGIDRKIEVEEKVLEKYEKMKKGMMERLLKE